MMEPVLRIDGNDSDAVNGKVVLSPLKMMWNIGMVIGALALAPFTFSLEAFFLFLGATYFSLLIGHSVGMHRMMIHRSFECSKTLERILIYIGVLVGMSGPFGVIRIHDIRDWAQRQEACNDFFSHKRHLLLDLWWQLTSKFEFENPPRVEIESKYADDKFLVFLDKTWPLHQVAPAIILYLLGGWSFIVWGVLLRVRVSIVGHWTITYFCHNPGPGKWKVVGASAQASNLTGLGLLTYGECWHNNHHAFPESAQIGLDKGQTDPAWWFIKLLKTLGLARNVGMPRPIEKREDLLLKN